MSYSTATVRSLNPTHSIAPWPLLYGPEQSRRLGFSLGVSLLPPEEKTCNFDCLYCECGWTPWMKTPWTWFPSLNELEETLNESFPMLARRHPSLDTITFSGNGEPTLYPEFPAAVNLVRKLGRKYLPWARIAILTNGTTLGDRGIFNAVRQVDIKCVKLDAGRTWMNRPREGDQLNVLLSVWAKIPNLTLQSFFSEGRFDNTCSEWLDPWIKQVKWVKPRRVQLFLHSGPHSGRGGDGKSVAFHPSSHRKATDFGGGHCSLRFWLDDLGSISKESCSNMQGSSTTSPYLSHFGTSGIETPPLECDSPNPLRS